MLPSKEVFSSKKYGSVDVWKINNHFWSCNRLFSDGWLRRGITLEFQAAAQLPLKSHPGFQGQNMSLGLMKSWFRGGKHAGEHKLRAEMRGWLLLDEVAEWENACFRNLKFKWVLWLVILKHSLWSWGRLSLSSGWWKENKATERGGL